MSRKTSTRSLVAKSEEVLVSYSADVTGKGLLGFRSRRQAPRPFGPVSGNGDPRKPDQPQQPDPSRDGRRSSPARATAPALPSSPPVLPSPRPSRCRQQPAAQQAAGGTPPAAVALRRRRTRPGGGAPGRHAGRTARRRAVDGTPKLPTDPSLKPAARRRRWSRRREPEAAAAVHLDAVAAGGGRRTVAPAPTGAAASARGCRSRARSGRWRCDGRRHGTDGPRRRSAQGKEKRRDPNLAPDEDLYTEDRPWTEAVIGNRRRKDVQDGKESK